MEIPFGAKDSKLIGWTYTIPKGYEAKIENGKIIVKKSFQSGLTPFQRRLYDYAEEYELGEELEVNPDDVEERFYLAAKELLQLAKEEICKDCHFKKMFIPLKQESKI